MNSDPLPKTYLDIAIHDYDPVVKAKIYEIVAKSVFPKTILTLQFSCLMPKLRQQLPLRQIYSKVL